MKRLYHWLGSVYFAILLIASTAMFVIVGTFIESKKESHRFAANLTYSNPIFLALLWGFFVNILFSATRRYPFKRKHIPFLTTHLGLLMILGGVLIKSYFGVQGTLMVAEGMGNQEIILPDSYALYVEAKERQGSFELRDFLQPWAGLQIKRVYYTPHSKSQMETWIKGDHLFISGLNPFPVYPADGETKACGHVEPFAFYALRGNHIEEAAKKAFIHDLNVVISNPDGSTKYEGPFKERIDGIKLELDFDYSPELGFVEPSLIAELGQDKVKIPLKGNRSLENINLTTPFLGSPTLNIDLNAIPKIVFIENDAKDIYLFAFDSHGRVHTEAFKRDAMSSYIAYDGGFGGYAIQTEIPFRDRGLSRKEAENNKIDFLKDQLKKSLESSIHLSPPLSLLRDASYEKFPDIAMQYLQKWHQSRDLIYRGEKILPSLNWDLISEKEYKTCYWMCMLLPDIQTKLLAGHDFINILEDNGWPLIEQFKELKKNPGPCSPDEVALFLDLLAQQVYAVAEQLPSKKEGDEISDEALFSAYLRLYSIQLANIMPVFDEKRDEGFFLETPLAIKYDKEMPLDKLEDNIPALTLMVSDGNNKEFMTLGYDRYGSGLKWPALKGKYLFRFQPKFSAIPYRIRLRDARQINYPNSTQPYSYESDLLITDTRTGETVEKTISMNNVHETWDGYRFYLANISPGVETAVQRVQIAVNHDPAKYFLTYPGAIILSLGIILLFWLKPYTR